MFQFPLEENKIKPSSTPCSPAPDDRPFCSAQNAPWSPRPGSDLLEKIATVSFSSATTSADLVPRTAPVVLTVSILETLSQGIRVSPDTTVPRACLRGRQFLRVALAEEPLLSLGPLLGVCCPLPCAQRLSRVEMCNALTCPCPFRPLLVPRWVLCGRTTVIKTLQSQADLDTTPQENGQGCLQLPLQ